MNNLTLKKIDQTNFIDAFHLELQDGQEKFVSHPIRSLAQAYVYYSQCTPFGIYFENKMVGYVMVIYDYDLSEYNIWHMMIDKHEQGKGVRQSRTKRMFCLHRSKALWKFLPGSIDLQRRKSSCTVFIQGSGIFADREP